MLRATVVTLMLIGSVGFASAQKADSGTAVTSDPAKSSATTGLNNSTTGSSRSGSGSATSGGRDANGDQGRDAMPDTSIGVRPLDQQNKTTGSKERQ